MTFQRDDPPSIQPPVPMRTPKTPGTGQCGCGRTISGNKLLCKRCGDSITAAINGLVRDQRTQEQAQMQWADDGGPA